jgi:cell division protein FtsI/penicillin-binding protein 2
MLLGLLILLLFGILFLNQSSISKIGFYEPIGYIKRVEDLIATGRLSHSPPVEQERVQRPWGSIAFIEATAEANAKKAAVQDEFYNESRRLRDDIDQFNEKGEGVFSIHKEINRKTGTRRNVIHFDRTAYNFHLPYPKSRPMDSKFSFGGTEMPTLGGDGIVLGFRKLEKDIESPLPEDIEELPLRAWFQPSPKSGGFYQELGYNLLGEENGPIFKLRATQDGATLQILHSDRFSPFVNGTSLQRPDSDQAKEFVEERRAGQPKNTYLLKVGDRLRIIDRHSQRPDSEMILRYGNYDNSSMMQSQLENGHVISQVDPEIARSLPFTQQIVDATNAYGSGKDGIRPPNVQHTVNQDLNTNLQIKLEEYVRKFDTNLAVVPDTEYEPACIAVVDAINGDVVAIPSYPSPQELESLTLKYQTGRAPDSISETKISRLKWNQNFQSVPIGSTTKPILATAIWSAFPDYARLVIIEPAESAGEIFGVKFPRTNPITTVSAERTINYVDFLGKSSNTYTASLYFLTLATPESFQINRSGAVQATTSSGLDFSRYIKGSFIPNGLSSPSLPANEMLAECFDIDLDLDYSAGSTKPRDRKFIAPLMRQLDIKDDEPLPTQFTEVTPERTNLNLQEIDIVRGELVSLLLGGSTNRWSNLKLAEAYARIGSGKRVTARLLRDSESDELPKFELMPDPKAIELVHEGLTASWFNTGNGYTAAGIRGEVIRQTQMLATQNLNLKFLAKTGTPIRTKGRECAVFAFYAEISDERNSALSAVAVTIYLQDRAASRGVSRNSGVAVELGKQILPDLVDWMKKSEAVQSHTK